MLTLLDSGSKRRKRERCDQMDKNAVTIIAALIAFVSSLLVYLQGRKQFYSTTVSKERLAWIDDIRRLCTELCTVCEQYDVDEITPEAHVAFLSARNGILIRLNPMNEEYPTDKRLIELLEEPDFQKVKNNIQEVRIILMAINQSEWIKVKTEHWGMRRLDGIQVQLNRATPKKADREA